MEQKFLDQAQSRLDELKDLEKQLEDIKKQIKDKECEIERFKQDWVNNCNHVFYRIQRLCICEFYTVGYHCCLCGKYEELKDDNDTPPKQTSCRHVGMSPVRKRPPARTYLPPHSKETHEFIGTVIDSIYSDGKKSDEERYPIPSEYQAEVDSKNEQLNKLKTELDDLQEQLATQKEAVSTFKSDLSKATRLLMNHFRYPQTVELPPFRWDRDDFNYDPID